MKKAWKIGLGMLGITSITTITVASVISCSNNNNDSSNKDQKEASSSLAYIPYSDLSKTVLINGKTGKASWTYDEALNYWTKVWNQETTTEAGFQKVVSTALESLSHYNSHAYFQNNYTNISIKNLTYQITNKNINLFFTVTFKTNQPKAIVEGKYSIQKATLSPIIFNAEIGSCNIPINNNNYLAGLLISRASLFSVIRSNSYVKARNNSYIANYNYLTDKKDALFYFLSTYNKDLNFGDININNVEIPQMFNS